MNTQRNREQQPLAGQVRLIDCFTEILTYTLYLIQGKHQDQGFDTVLFHYQELLERSKKLAHTGKIPSTAWKKGFFPVCAWVDEKILCSSWPERGKWKQNQLQVKFFQTANAGREFFSRLAKLKDSERDVREVYTYCLSLGFTGQYYSEEEQMELSEIRTENLLQFFAEDQDVSIPERLFPQAYQAKAAQQKKKFRRGTSLLTFVMVSLPPVIVCALYVVYASILNQEIGRLFGIN